MSAPDTQPAGRLLAALARVLAPLVRLLIARGVTYQATSEMLKRVYVRAAQKHFAGDGEDNGFLFGLCAGGTDQGKQNGATDDQAPR